MEFDKSDRHELSKPLIDFRKNSGLIFLCAKMKSRCRNGELEPERLRKTVERLE